MADIPMATMPKQAHDHTTTRDGADLDAVVDDNVPQRYRGTADDKRDMMVLGKQQQLRRNFKATTMTAFAAMVVCAWEGLLPLSTYVLIDGGPGLLFFGFIATATGMTFVYLSISEMASISPTSAGQYHWVSEFGPPKYQRFLSYCTGWLCAVGFQTFLASVCFMVGTMIQGLIVLNNPETYVFQAWHGTLLSIAIISFAIIFNTFLAGRLPLIEGLAVIVHICGIFGVIIPLWVLAERAPSSILTTFLNNGGWPTTGLSSMVGLTTPVSIFIGYDCSAHLAEELDDAAKNLPRSIMASVALNGFLAFLMAVTLCYTVGDADTILVILDSPTGYPFLEVFMNAVQSKGAVNAMTFLVIFGLTNCAISEVATASRQTWAFARDNGLPFSTFLSRVEPGQNIPLRAVLVSLAFTTLLSLINIGSDVALNAINSLAGTSLLTSYVITISCMIWRRTRAEPLPACVWSLGKYGLPINIAAICFLLPVWFFAFWPLASPVTAESMNWASTMFGGLALIASIHWLIRARHIYTGPVVQVRRDLDIKDY